MDELWDNHWEQSGDDPNTSRRVKIQTLGTVGGPVTCVSLPQTNVCVYSQGSGLERIVLESFPSSATLKRRRDRTIVFENGTAVHGIRYSSKGTSSNEQGEDYTAVFGGRQVAIVRHVVPTSTAGGEESIKPMEILPLVVSSSSSKQQQAKCIHCSDWIWDVQWIPTLKTSAAEATQQNVSLLVGLAHNTVERWKFTAINPTNMKGDAPCLEASRRTTWIGAKRCLLYCLDFSVTSCLSPSTATVSVAVGTAMQDIRIWQVACDTTTPVPTTEQEANTMKHESMVAKEQACLLGHQGVIHSVKWISSSRKGLTPQLVSASDDRSIRLWEHQLAEQKQNVLGETEIGWHCRWIGWGHTARIWGLGILQLPTQTNDDNINDSNRSDLIVSTGEDGTARLWDSQKGTELAVFRGHPCQCVWSVGTNNESGIIATGGNDGTVALHDVGSMAAISTSNKNSKEIIEGEAGRPGFDMLLVPEDQPKVLPSSMDDATGATTKKEDDSNKISYFAEPAKKKKKKKKQPVGQIVVGMKFYNADRLLVATRGGSLFSVNASTATVEQDWITVGSWAVSLGEDGACKNDKQVDPKEGCCMAVYLDSDIKSLWLAIGTSRGEIVAMELSNTSDELKITRRTVLAAPKQYRSVQGLSWLPSSAFDPSSRIPQLSLLSFHINTILWWPPFCQSGETMLSGPLWALQMETQAIPISFSFDEHNRRFYVGDTRGNLVLFHLDVDESTGKGNDDNETHFTLTPTSTLARLHQKEHVTDIVAVPTTCGNGGSASQRVLSVGNDGCIVESFLNTENGMLRSGLRVAASSALTGILKLWVVEAGAEEESVIVSGYYGNIFVVINVTRGYEIFRIDTGGRQRQLDFCSPSIGGRPQPTSVKSVFNLAINVHHKQDGRNAIMLYAKLANTTQPGANRETDSFCHQHQQALGVGLHGETIYSASLFRYANGIADSNGLALLTGSEDCGSKISFFENDTLVATKRLPAQESCVRAVCSSPFVAKFRHSTLLAVGGGKLTLQFFLVTNTCAVGAEVTGSRDVQIFSIGLGKTSEKNDIDHRINSVASLLLESPNGDVEDDHVVAAGDSQGNCHIYRVTADEKLQSRSWIGLPIPVEEAKRRPILSVELIRVRSRLLLMTGTTGGDIRLFDLPGTTDAEEWNSLILASQQGGIITFPTRRVGSFRAHQMGVNSVSASLLLHQDSSSIKVRVCSGGDDQAISLCEIQIVFDATGTKIVATTVLELKTYRESSSSAIKEVRMLDEKHVLSVGYSQRLALWKHSEEAGLKLLWTAPASVGDINCLAYARTPDDEQNILPVSKATIAVCGAGVGLFSINLL